jgi:hypothetical protein
MSIPRDLSLRHTDPARVAADRAETAWRDDEAGSSPHLALACGHLSPPGSGPLAEAGYGYCPEHGVSAIQVRRNRPAG